MSGPSASSRAHRSAELRAVLGARVALRRVELGLRQEDLGQIAGMHRTYVGSIERGERNVSLENLDRLASALGTTIAELLEDC